MTDKPTVVVRIQGRQFLHATFCGDVRLLIVDEGCKRDRVYQLTIASTPEQIATIIGDSLIGNKDDGMLSNNERQAIVAADARLGGDSLRIVTVGTDSCQPNDDLLDVPRFLQGMKESEPE